MIELTLKDGLIRTKVIMFLILLILTLFAGCGKTELRQDTYESTKDAYIAAMESSDSTVMDKLSDCPSSKGDIKASQKIWDKIKLKVTEQKFLEETESTAYYHLLIDISDGGTSGFETGLNERWLGLVKKDDGKWYVNALATSPPINSTQLKLT